MDRLAYMNKLASHYDVIMVQEHWFQDFQLHKLREASDCKTVCCVSGMDPTQPLSGRPYGGCAILIKNDRINVEFINTTCRRLCACIVIFPDNHDRFLLLNVYMPNESVDSDCSMFFNVLLELTSVIEIHPDVNHIVIGGDFNTDLARVDSSYVELLSDFCDQHQLNFCMRNEISEVDFTYLNDFTQAKSMIDHFIVSDQLFVEMAGYYSI
jgi:exonuclease III